MCGIAGVMDFEERSSPEAAEAAREDIRQMMALMHHRGPDGAGLYQRPQIIFGHRRLAIVDPDSGWQPLVDPSGRYALCFNGEIYNAPELRRDLLRRGCRFRSRTDTEVLLHLFILEGPECLTKLNGMFAFAIWDSSERTLFLARDRFGVKPLYVTRLKGRLAFASEAKALIPLLDAVVPNPEALRDYFTFQLCVERTSFFQGVERLLPATWLKVHADGREEEQTWWQLDFTPDPRLTSDHLAARVGWLLEDSVRLNIRGDAPVGAYLSGGMDSSSVVMMASGVLGVPLPCFSGGFDLGPEFNELPYARRTAAAAGAELHEYLFDATQFEACLEDLTYTLDEPTAGPGAFPQYMVARAAAEQVRVVLGGQGGDEIFGGYARFLIAYLDECIRGAIFDAQKGGPFVVTFESILPNLPLLKPYIPTLKSFWAEGLFESSEQRYLRLLQKFSAPGRYLSAEAMQTFMTGDSAAPLRRDFNRADLSSLINRMTYVELRHILPALLQVEDRVSMKWSLESRVPFLDHRLVELVARTPPTIKFEGGALKILLKRAMAGLVPEEVLERKDKMGFPVPLQQWARGSLGDCLRALLLEGPARTRGLWNPAGLAQVFDSVEKFGRDMWGLVAVEQWHRCFVDKPKSELLPSSEAVAEVRAQERILDVQLSG